MFNMNGVEAASNAASNSNYIFSILITAMPVILIAVVLVIVFFLYKLKQNKHEQNQAKELNNKINQKTQKYNKKSSLATPSSINKCIRAFLENTKRN